MTRQLLILALLASVADIHAADNSNLTTVPDELTSTTSDKLWSEFVAAPYTHPNIPNVSFAGYQFSERLIPSPNVVVNVRDTGAKADGETDDSEAFRIAIEKVQQAGGGAILVPAGHYKLNDAIILPASNLVLRGEGSGKTILEFTRPVSQISANPAGELRREGNLTEGVAASWYGGVIWVEPGGARIKPTQSDINVQPLEKSVPVVAPARQGEFALEVSAEDAAKLKPLIGKTVPVTWTGGTELAMEIAGHPSMRAYDWSTYRELYDGVMTWIWANQIEAVEGTRVIFKKPLRLAAHAGQVRIGTFSPYVTEVGVEGLTVKFPHTKYLGHHKELGYNGVMFRTAAHCWVRDVEVVNADSGLILGGECINCTVEDFVLRGRENHHGLMARFMSHDNLFQRFRIESQPLHGINTEGLASGNVWRDGEMIFGTFDYHRMMSFDSVRTNITVNNTGSSGGNDTHGPGVGRRICHWNIRITNGKGRGIAQPAQYPSAALVGIQGAPLDLRATDLKRVPDGLNKGCVIADQGQEPSPADLFEAQLQLRLPPAD